MIQSLRVEQRSDLEAWGDGLRAWAHGSDEPHAIAAIANVLEPFELLRQVLTAKE
jgi:hypothetical protein